jgi:hypothetical protein
VFFSPQLYIPVTNTAFNVFFRPASIDLPRIDTWGKDDRKCCHSFSTVSYLTAAAEICLFFLSFSPGSAPSSVLLLLFSHFLHCFCFFSVSNFYQTTCISTLHSVTHEWTCFQQLFFQRILVDFVIFSTHGTNPLIFWRNNVVHIVPGKL